jgi:hypothetical protein
MELINREMASREIAEPFGTNFKITSVLIDFLDSELLTEKLYDHGNLYCSEIIIIVN